MADPPEVIDKLAWIELVDDRILSTRSKDKDVYYIPGGKREGNETDSQALMREVEEELSVQLVPETIEYFGTFNAQAHGKAQGVDVQMTCYAASYMGELAAASEIAEFVWLEYADREKCSPVDQIIFDWLLDQGRLR